MYNVVQALTVSCIIFFGHHAMCLKWPLQKASVLTVDSSDNSASSDDLTSTDDPPVEVISLLSRLKCPAKSDLSQKRKIQHNPP